MACKSERFNKRLRENWNFNFLSTWIEYFYQNNFNLINQIKLLKGEKNQIDYQFKKKIIFIFKIKL